MEREVVQVKSEVILARKEVNPVRQHVDLATYGGHRCRDEMNLSRPESDRTICEPHGENLAVFAMM